MREREDANRTREAGDSVLVKTEDQKSEISGRRVTRLGAEFCAILFTSILIRIGAMRAVAAVLFVLIFVTAGADAAQVRIFAGARFDSKAWAKLQKLNVKELGKDRNLDAHVGQLVELHFQFRSKELRHLKPNWYQASVWQAAPGGKRGFVSVPVMLANTDLKAFEGFTTDHRSTADLKIYGQVLYDFGINYTFVRVIGTNTFVDGDGYTNVTW